MTTATDAQAVPLLPLDEPGFWQDVNVPLAAALAEGSVARSPDGGWWVLGHDEVEAVLKDPAFKAADLLALQGMSTGPVWEWWQTLMFSKNPPEHTRLRRLVTRAFTPRRIEALRPRIASITAELLAPALESGRMEVMSSLAHHLPSRVMGEVLGIPDEDHEVFVDWTTDLGLAFGAAGDDAVRRRVERALADLDQYVRALVEDRRTSPGDDLLSELIAVEEEGDRLETDELVGLIENLMFAGHDTTRGSLGVMVEVLASQEGLIAELRDQPSLVANTVEEILRWEAITFSTSRLATEDREIGGVPITAGTPVGLCLCAASRDPRRYEDPDRFDVHREEIRPPTFGAGVHFCLGAGLARVELQEALLALVERFRAVELVDPPARWVPFAFIRRYEALPVRVSAG